MRKQSMWKNLLGGIMAGAMVLSSAPVGVLAAEDGFETEAAEEFAEAEEDVVVEEDEEEAAVVEVAEESSLEEAIDALGEGLIEEADEESSLNESNTNSITITWNLNGGFVCHDGSDEKDYDNQITALTHEIDDEDDEDEEDEDQFTLRTQVWPNKESGDNEWLGLVGWSKTLGGDVWLYVGDYQYISEDMVLYAVWAPYITHIVNGNGHQLKASFWDEEGEEKDEYRDSIEITQPKGGKTKIIDWLRYDKDFIPTSVTDKNEGTYSVDDYVQFDEPQELSLNWSKVVTLTLDAGEQEFVSDDFDEGEISDDNKKVTYSVPAGIALKRWGANKIGEVWSYYSVNEYMDCNEEGWEFDYWTIGSPEGKRVIYEYDEDDSDDDIYPKDSDGSYIIPGENGITLYAHWKHTYDDEDYNQDIVFEEEQDLEGKLNVSMLLKTKAQYKGDEDKVSLEYEWWDGYSGEYLTPTMGEDDYSIVEYTPTKRDPYICITVYAYDFEGKSLGVNSTWMYIYCDDGARVVNEENTVKIAKGGTSTFTVQTRGTTGNLSYEWHWYDKTKKIVDDEGWYYDWKQIENASSSSYSISNITNNNIVYICDAYDDLGHVGSAIFNIDFCTAHTGSWVVTKPATEAEAGVETRTCTTCGAVETRSIAKIVAPITISKKPAQSKPKAAAKGKVTISWKKFKQTKKTKKIWKQIKKVEVQYSTDPTFTTGVTSKLVGKKKTSLKAKLEKNTTYYIRIRYTDGAGGYSNWSSVKKVKTKKK